MERDSSKFLVRPKINFDEAKTVVFDLFGLKVDEILELNGFDDKNFRISVDREVNHNKFINSIIDSGYVLKIINTLESQDDLSFQAQHELLVHLNKNGIRCPKPILTKDQKPFQKIVLSSGEHIVKLLDYIPGEILFKVRPTPELIYEVGILTAKLDNALQTFNHPAYQKNMQWSLRSAPDILHYLYSIKDTERQNLVRRIIKEFSSRVLTIEDKLEKGLIHGDINEQNLIVAQDNSHFYIKAIIDFGDTHYTCYLYELAIAMTYMIFTSDQIDSGGFVLAGYSSIRRPSRQEIELLRICVMARLCQSLVLGAHASIQEPDNQYVLTTSKKGWGILERMDKISENALLHQWTSQGTPRSL